MISPFHIATGGYLCSPLGVAADGYICLLEKAKVPIEQVLGGGSGKKGVRVAYKEQRKEITLNRLYMEDDDILVIIKVFLECQ